MNAGRNSRLQIYIQAWLGGGNQLSPIRLVWIYLATCLPRGHLCSKKKTGIFLKFYCRILAISVRFNLFEKNRNLLKETHAGQEWSNWRSSPSHCYRDFLRAQNQATKIKILNDALINGTDIKQQCKEWRITAIAVSYSTLIQFNLSSPVLHCFS